MVGNTIQLIGVKLIYRVDGLNLYTGYGIKPLSRDALMNLSHRTLGARIAITVRGSKEFALRVKTHIIHRPACYSNRGDAFGGKFGALLQSLFQFLADAL